ncbi:NUDIX hydrolase [Alkalicoccus urumqiensis]|uniref:DNA mismatch repair protein MutT n=1 Tax=Alkalicoccus urumqiensis TaxID=1548213 RepID=A0A2P6MF64_ALKUR|nr:NUDIX domain-containing protein [Alkalicoccus urumqiensis]PRO64914.1 DNA mismatch repair protein MutT [Alkalicoccus urumqiensis]
MGSYYQYLRKNVGQYPLLLPGSCIILYNAERNEVLLQKRDDGEWGLPGGLMELGERFEETAVREMKEETGVALDPAELQLFNVFSGEDYFVTAPNGDPYYAVTALYTALDPEQPLSEGDEETEALDWFKLDALPQNKRRNHAHFLTLFQKQQEEG